MLCEAAEQTKIKIIEIVQMLRVIEASEETSLWTEFEKKQLILARKTFGNVNGYNAAGFFQLNRQFMSSVLVALVTYLIVLLQFKVSDGTGKISRL